MLNFTLSELTHYGCKSRVFALGINGSFPYLDFVQAIKDDNNLAPELGDIVPSIKYFANGLTPFLPNGKFKKLNMNKGCPYSVYEAKSRQLRAYLFTDENGVINILGGHKKTQKKDLKYINELLKDYRNSKK